LRNCECDRRRQGTLFAEETRRKPLEELSP
jgi:hypothetical protein